MLRWCAGPAGTAAVMLLAACGGGSAPSASHSASASASPSVGRPPATAVLGKQVNSALKSATSVHMSGTITQGGSTTTIDIDLTRSNDVYGQLGYNGKPFTMLATQGHAYIKVTAATTLKEMGLPSAACPLVCGKYFEMTTAQSKNMLSGMSWSGFWGQLNSTPRLSYVRTVTLDGQPTWEIKTTDGTTAYVAAQGTHYPLRVMQRSGRIDFTQWNSVTIPSPPPASQVVDMNQLTNV
jgi:hypothetical protein